MGMERLGINCIKITADVEKWMNYQQKWFGKPVLFIPSKRTIVNALHLLSYIFHTSRQTIVKSKGSWFVFLREIILNVEKWQ